MGGDGQSGNSHPGPPVPRAQVYTTSLQQDGSQGVGERLCAERLGPAGPGGPLAREQLLLIRPERKQQVLTRHLLGALYQPAIQLGAEGAPCAHLPHAALAQILGRTPQQPPDGRRPQGASPASERGWRVREENGGPASGHTSGLGTAGSKKLRYFLLPKTWVW